MGDAHLLFAGLDIGSLTTKALLMGEEGSILSSIVIPTGAHAARSAERALEEALKAVGASHRRVSCLVTTGYGRDLVKCADKKVTEITCHARGAFFALPQVRTVVDIGGQDAKVISLDEDGGVVDFVMNDRCAAGTGRFLQVMAEALEVSVEDLAGLSEQVSEGAPISSMCTVFAESEVISLLAQGHDIRSIALGLHESVAQRIASMGRRLDIRQDVVMTGGVAYNRGVVSALTRALGVPVLVPDSPQVMGALGAALLAQQIGRR